MILENEHKIQLIKHFGGAVNSKHSDRYFSRAIFDDSPALDDIASALMGLVEREAELEGLIRRGLRTHGEADGDFRIKMKIARDAISEYGRKYNDYDYPQVKQVCEDIERSLSLRMGDKRDY